MKAHKTTLSVRELQKTIGQWKSRKITDSTIAKLLELMLGMTAYMNEDAVYPVENFYDISKALKFKNARYLVEAVRLSGAFGIVPGDNVYGMSSFYSCLWKEKEKTDDSAETLPVKLPQGDIYNIYTIQDNKNNTSSGRISSAEKSLEAARNFFHLINKNRVDINSAHRQLPAEGGTGARRCLRQPGVPGERIAGALLRKPGTLYEIHPCRAAVLAEQPAEIRRRAADAERCRGCRKAETGTVYCRHAGRTTQQPSAQRV